MFPHPHLLPTFFNFILLYLFIYFFLGGGGGFEPVQASADTPPYYTLFLRPPSPRNFQQGTAQLKLMLLINGYVHLGKAIIDNCNISFQ